MSSPENFDSLEKLLRLKRYEKPPPRYYNEFSGRVVSRIEAGEGRISWWEKFGFDLRPAFAAAAGMLACGLVVYGVATADGSVEISPESVAMGSPLPIVTAADALVVNSEHSLSANSTNPLPSYGPSIDRRFFDGKVIPASFAP
jgi:hypothetical protein